VHRLSNGSEKVAAIETGHAHRPERKFIGLAGSGRKEAPEKENRPGAT